MGGLGVVELVGRGARQEATSAGGAGMDPGTLGGRRVGEEGKPEETRRDQSCWG